MKLRLFPLALVFLTARLVSAQIAADPFQITKIARHLISTPEYQYDGADTFLTNSRDRWLAIDFGFSAARMNRTREQWFASFVLNKNQTPFAPFYWDHYEQIKPPDPR
ncbi:MAG TPA: hypothetical protein VGI85_15840 [Chthoniobacterales bacterium]|jgi:hypothetical protein